MVGDPTSGMKPISRDQLGGGGASPAEPRPTPQAAGSSDEVAFLRRRVEQLKAELRLARGGGQAAKKLEETESEMVRLTEERDQLKERITELENQIATEGGDVKVKRAGAIASTAGEVVTGLNDVLSNLRINVMAAEGEFEQFHDAIPRASYELIREALRSSADDMETARDLLRKLRELAGQS
jgi:chromosome segregation ATPase